MRFGGGCLKEATDELPGVQSQSGRRSIATIVLTTEANPSVLQAEQSAIGNSPSMGVASQILQNPLGTGQRRLAVKVPLGAAGLGQQGLSDRVGTERLQGSGESQSTLAASLIQHLQEIFAEQTAEGANRKEEEGTGGNPLRLIFRETTARNQTVQVGMMHQVLAPGM